MVAEQSSCRNRAGCRARTVILNVRIVDFDISRSATSKEGDSGCGDVSFAILDVDKGRAAGARVRNPRVVKAV